MRFFTALSIFPSLLALVAATSTDVLVAEAEALKLADSYVQSAVEAREAEADASVLEQRVPKSLQGRACRENGCTCKKVRRGQVRDPPFSFYVSLSLYPDVLHQ